MTFKELGIRDDLCNVCEEVGWKEPTDIQKSSIPIALTGVDIIGLAETGGGKTGAFLLPILNDWLNRNKPIMFALILTPTRELAAQIQEQFNTMAHSKFGLKCTLIIGGEEMCKQITDLGSWDSHIVVATPGRVVSLMEKSKQARKMLETIEKLVIDEADRMLQLEFESDMESISKVLPKKNSFINRKKLGKGQLKCIRQTQLFSATFSNHIEKLAGYLLSKPVKVYVDNQLRIPKQLNQSILVMQYVDRVGNLFALLRHYLANKVNTPTALKQQENDEEQGEPKAKQMRLEVSEEPERELASAIVFVTTCKQTKPLEIFLNKMGASAVALHSQLSQNQRDLAIDRFRTGEANILIATDIASRGLDVDHVRLVVNYDLPQNPDWYKHRVGRTARAGRDGTAVTFVHEINRDQYIGMEKRLGLAGKVPVHPEVKLGKKDLIKSHNAIREARKEQREKEEKLNGLDLDFNHINTNFSTKRAKLSVKEKKINK